LIIVIVIIIIILISHLLATISPTHQHADPQFVTRSQSIHYSWCSRRHITWWSRPAPAVLLQQTVWSASRIGTGHLHSAHNRCWQWMPPVCQSIKDRTV